MNQYHYAFLRNGTEVNFLESEVPLTAEEALKVTASIGYDVNDCTVIGVTNQFTPYERTLN